MGKMVKELKGKRTKTLISRQTKAQVVVAVAGAEVATIRWTAAVSAVDPTTTAEDADGTRTRCPSTAISRCTIVIPVPLIFAPLPYITAHII